jgi:general secretion pathway protein K
MMCCASRGMWSEMFLKRLMRRSWTIKQFSSDKGLALIMVLWVLAVLSVIVLSFAFMARTEVFSTISFRDGMEKKFLAEAGIERGIMELFYRNANKNQMSAIEGSEIVRIDGRKYEGELGGSTYSFSITDESGKVNINSLTDANGIILNNLLVNLGIPGEDASTIVDSILDWKDADDLHRLHGAEDTYYQALPVPYKAKNDKFDTLEELLLVRGVTPEILFGSGSRPGLINFLTVFSKGSAINLNAAVREVLMALPNMTSSMADRIVEFRETAELRGQQDVSAITGDVFRTIAPFVGFTESNVYTIEGRGLKKDEKRGYAIRAVMSIEGGNQHRYLYYKSPSDVKN